MEINVNEWISHCEWMHNIRMWLNGWNNAWINEWQIEWMNKY